jgi:sugar lactone lactonase YvrE
MSASRVLGLMIASSWLVVGCSAAKKIDVGGTCILNSDCNGSLVCTMGKCHDACHMSADCPTGQSCIIATDQSTVCQLPVETHCLYDSDCPTSLKCAADQRCHNQCQGDVDCPSGQTCTTQTCAEPTQVDADANVAATTDASTTEMPDADANVAATTDAATTDMPDASFDVHSDAGFSDSGGHLDSPCDYPNAHGCDGPMSRQQTICDSISMTCRANGLCSKGEYCDRSTGDCLGVVPECAENQPGDRVCMNATLRECGPDLVTTTLADSCATATGECARCRPVTLVTGQSSPRGIAIVGGYVYWSNMNTNTSAGAGVFRVPRNGGDVETVAADYRAEAMATDGTYVYWVDESTGPAGGPGANQVYRVAISGGTPTALAPAADGYHPGIAVSDTHVYWTDQITPAIRRAPKEGGAVETLAAPNSGDAFGIAVDTGVVYWAIQSGGTVMSTPAEGGASSVLASGQSMPMHLFVNSTYVYWTNRTGGQIMRVQRSGGSPEPLATGQAAPFAMAGDASNVYWTNSNGGSLMKVRLEGGVPVMMASGFGSPLALASDETSLCWTSFADGTVMLIQK